MKTAYQYNRKHTYKDYLNWNDDKRREIIEGIVYDMSPSPSRQHQEISIELASQMRVFLRGKSCHVYAAPFDVRLPLEGENEDDIDTIVQPDIIVVCNECLLDDKGCKGAPDLIIEILSPSSAAKDLKEKFFLYEKHGVREYWIVYPHEQIVHVYKLNENGLYSRPEIYASKDKIAVKLLGDLVIDLNPVFEILR